jgi:hypothetical protein
MSVILSNKVDGAVPWDDVMLRVAVSLSNKTDSRFWPYPVQGGVRARYNQRCVDTIIGEWVAWATYYQDVYGAEYPGSGFDSGTYRVESIIYDREQG